MPEFVFFAMWHPLVEDNEQRALLVAAAHEFGKMARASAKTTDELADVAILDTYDEALSGDDASDALARAVLASESVRRVGLYSGFAKIGWTVAHVAEHVAVDEACSAIDRQLLEELTSLSEWDLIGGLVGIGVYALERGEPGRTIVARVLDGLERLAQPRGRGLAWYTAPERLPPHQLAEAPYGYWNLGFAHGTPGAIAFLARCVDADVERDRAARLLDAAVDFLLDAEPADPRGRYPGWQAERSAPSSRSRARLAWCYGDLGVSVALFAAATARGNDRWRAEALAMARSCAHRSHDEADVREIGICHGAAGVAHMFSRLHQASGDTELGEAARIWLSRTLEMRTGRAAINATLLSGSSGVALVLLAAASEIEPRWDRVLLVDLAPL